MSIEDAYLTLLTPDGEFLRAKKQDNVMLGDEIAFFPIKEPIQTRASRWEKLRMKRGLMASLSAVAMIVLLLSFIPMLVTSKEAYAYVSIDINPSIEIGVDDVLNVISIEAYNKEGEDLLKVLPNWKKQHIDVVTKNIINKSIESGYLVEGKEVLITTVINEENNLVKEELQKDLNQLVASYKEDKKIEVTAVESNTETREKAKQQGLSTGKLIQKEKNAQKELVETEKENEIQEVEETQESPSNEQSAESKESSSQEDDGKENNASQKANEKGKDFGQSKAAEKGRDFGQSKANEKGKNNSELKGNGQQKNDNQTARPNQQKIPTEVKKHVGEKIKKATERAGAGRKE